MMKLHSYSFIAVVLLLVTQLLPITVAQFEKPNNEPSHKYVLLASSSRTEALMAWLRVKRIDYVKDATFVAPRSLAERLESDVVLSSLTVQEVPNVDLGGDIHLAAEILAGEVDGVIYFHDPLSTNKYEPDLKLLLRACDIGKVSLALNDASADMTLRGTAMARRAYLIFNPIAGQRDPKEDLYQIRKALEPHMVLTIIMTRPDVEAADQAKDVIKVIQSSYTSDYESKAMIIASGGDGTVSAIAGATIGSGIPFGVIPRGTANAFSVALGIPTDVEGACRNIVNGHVRVIDGAMCNDIPMVLLAGIGFEAGMVENASRELKDKVGALAYVLGGAKQMVTGQLFKCKIEIDGQTSEVQAGAVSVANVAPATSVFSQGFGEVIPDDGMLEITISTAKNMAEALDHMASLLHAAVVKQPSQTEGLLHARAKTVKVDCDPEQKIVIDGEMLEMNPVTFRVLPNAVQVLAPPVESEDD